jgi:hypothetical protein
MECGALFGRSPPEEKALAFWDRILGTCGGLAAATGKLVAPVEDNVFWALPLPPASDFPDLEAEMRQASALPVNPHTTGLWHKTLPAANALGHGRKGSRKSFGALGVDPP